MKLSRRKFMHGTATILAFPMINSGAFKVFANEEKTYSTRAVDLVNSTQVFDMLSLPYSLGTWMTAAFSENPKQRDGLEITNTQLKRILSCGIDVFHPAAGVGANEAATFIARTNALANEHPDHLRRIDSIEDLNMLKKGERVGYIVGIQNADHFHTLDDVNQYYHLGQRVSQLTYNSRNLIGTGSTDRSDGGLSDFGVNIIERMNEVGMAVDVSHCGDRTTLDAFEVSAKPVLITHSNVRKLAGGHVRCKPDDAIIAMAKAGSVMGITGVRQFVSDKEPTGIAQVIDHVDYIAKLVGIEHVGVGSDMDLDGYDDIPEPAYSALKGSYSSSYKFRGKIDADDFNHPKRTFDLVDGLIDRGYTDAHIQMVLGDNFKRVLADIWI
ncbi:dipeptidase [Kordiimonas aquimaris]|uniref:dipeptidase n=1 Tax=Kordiimonas aquimaris TaxID=707591 RepID=UPI0021D2B6A4|nr:dipeptidase [Kordiimonas aquimaris]